mmetsp:Transcript_3098/g.7485  ORF Transcript_3098/g.7485 Transcript_3098/m.7485 type:complete len:226 (-) Transcript_3098:259-936(-)
MLSLSRLPIAFLLILFCRGLPGASPRGGGIPPPWAGRCSCPYTAPPPPCRLADADAGALALPYPAPEVAGRAPAPLADAARAPLTLAGSAASSRPSAPPPRPAAAEPAGGERDASTSYMSSPSPEPPPTRRRRAVRTSACRVRIWVLSRYSQRSSNSISACTLTSWLSPSLLYTRATARPKVRASLAAKSSHAMSTCTHTSVTKSLSLSLQRKQYISSPPSSPSF